MDFELNITEGNKAVAELPVILPTIASGMKVKWGLSYANCANVSATLHLGFLTESDYNNSTTSWSLHSNWAQIPGSTLTGTSTFSSTTPRYCIKYAGLVFAQINSTYSNCIEELARHTIKGSFFIDISYDSGTTWFNLV